MKRLLAIPFVLVMFTGCLGENKELDRAMELRAELLCHNCSFHTEITADYGEEVYSFGMYCEGDSKGNLGFEVTSPETISGIRGRVSGDVGALTFSDAVLEFPLLADDQVTPVSAPYLLLKTLQGGYVRSVGEEDNLLRMTIDDSYEEDALQLDIWLDESNLPVRAEILYDGRRILTMVVRDFRIL